MRVNSQQGMTLAELMAAMSVAAILCALAVPTLGGAMERQRLRSHGLLLLGSANHARSEALRRNQPVYLCAANLKKNLELQGCQAPQAGASQQWREGGLSYADLGADNAAYDGGERLRLVMFDRERVSVAAPAGQLAWLPDGQMRPDGGLVFRLRSGHLCLDVTIAADGRASLGSVGDACA
ncbi:GspH/FimT family pseudopilin [Chromobacterium alticapitis]|nr:GspH/FimT family pseudopilin [Chromobacterium alticapitis]